MMAVGAGEAPPAPKSSDRAAKVGLFVSAVTVCAGLLLFHHGAQVRLALVMLATVVIAVTTVRASQHRQLVRRLRAISTPCHIAGLDVRTGELPDAAFVAGLGRPTIFCDHRLPGDLSTGELHAVLLHERAHQRARDPLRLLGLQLVTPIMRHLPFGRQWLAWCYAQREIAADRYAMAHGAQRSDLAAALLRLPPLAQAHVAGFTSATDLRLRALLGDDIASAVPLAVRRASLILPAVAASVMASAWLLHNAVDSTFGHLCC